MGVTKEKVKCAIKMRKGVIKGCEKDWERKVREKVLEMECQVIETGEKM